MNQSIGQRIAMLRTTKGVSARDMSLSLGQNESYINHIENGKTLPSMQMFLYICDYLKISPSVFFTFEDKNPLRNPKLYQKLQQLDGDDLDLVEALIKRLLQK